MLRETSLPHEIEGILERFVFHNDETGWSVVKISLQKKSQLITAVGNIFGVQPGESLRMKGTWVHNKEYGPEFHVDSYLSVMPGTLFGIEKYLGSGLIQGVGKEMAKRLVKAFGLDVLDIIEHHPERLTRVSGIGAVRSRRIVEGWHEHKDIKDVMIFLQSIGVSSAYATKIYKTYGNDAITVVKQDPYRLAIDIFGIGFKTADSIASHLGISSESPQRAKAGILYVLGQISDRGHVCYPLTALVESCAEELGIDKGIIEHAIQALAASEILAIEKRSAETFVYLRSLFVSETGVARLLGNFVSAHAIQIPIHIERAIAWFEERHHMELASEQKDAITSAIREKAVVITGGPGTGKTTLIRAIIEILEKKGLRIHLAAPTGRAAKRLSEVTRRTAKTIHRLLEYNPGEMGFDRNQAKPLKMDMLILDEVSMVDIVLFYHVLKALPPSARIILVGDADQLPSVGPGSVLTDIIDSQRVKTIHLEKIFRQAKRSLIVVNAHRVNHGQMPYTKVSSDWGDYEFLKHDDPSEALQTIKHLVSVEIPRKFGFDPILDIQILTPMHRGVLGVFNLNTTLQTLLNPSQEGIFRGGYRLCIGDKVMQVRNNYELGVFNGDMGRLVSISNEGKEVEVDFDGRIVPFEASDLDELTLAYACSIHKSQGNEYPAVIIALHTQHFIMLQRNLLYTAITRGKRFVAIVGSTRAMVLAIKNVNKAQRYSLLRHRLMGLLCEKTEQTAFF